MEHINFPAPANLPHLTMSHDKAFQDVFGLSLVSNIIQHQKGTQAALQAAMESALPVALEAIGTWEIVWGPVVWKRYPSDRNSGPDNIWYIAKNPLVQFSDETTHETYVLAIAASADTLHDWLVEDLDVGGVVDFEKWVKGSCRNRPVNANWLFIHDSTHTYIASGTAGGVWNLISTTAPSSAKGSSYTAPQFLANLRPDTPTARLVVTGHSLGGALAPTLALAMKEIGVLSAFSPDNVLVYPTAGASPGNENFAKRYAKAFPKSRGSDYKVWNADIINTLDIVPQAWCTNTSKSPSQCLENIPGMYGPSVWEVKGAIDITILDVNLCGITYFPLQSSSFTGAQTSSVPTTITKFFEIAGQQHVPQYAKHIGVPMPNFATLPVLESIRRDLHAKTPEEVRQAYPVIGRLESDANRVAADGVGPLEDEEAVRAYVAAIASRGPPPAAHDAADPALVIQEVNDQPPVSKTVAVV
ncbi:hypothetical protein JAAARDRAFT_196527 [Jaapia argillacea MUCL 33604]|uniref:Fungal lipase-type domain-containing protein n=1 Tax=Jaapia argillacea MUCL 33604 TaxID=933084 RepID=A0A067PI81_9AGAM|nr:hypothetical protein JAAARDRAFT_196527 [Jaapia argillacea MUCL 33604]